MAGWRAMAQDDHLLMIVDGDPGVRVEGTCRLRRAGGEVEEAIDAVVPFQRRWTGVGLRCDLRSDGRVSVEISRGGARSRTSVSRGRTVLEVG